MKYLSRGLLFFAFVSYLALELFFELPQASAYDVALFALITYFAIAEKLDNIE